MRASRVLAAVTALGALCSDAVGRGVPPQDKARPVFPGQLTVARFDMVALDAAGRPVSDLGVQDIEILENGKRQEIASFTRIDANDGSGDQRPSTNVVSNARADEGRAIFIIMDDANSLRARTEFIKDAARRLVTRLAPEDWVGLLWVTRTRGGAREFTRDHESVLQAIDQFSAVESQIERQVGPDDLPPGLSPFNSLQMRDDFNAPVGAEQSLAGTANLGKMYDAMRPIAMIGDIGKRLSAMQARRRIVVYIGQGALRRHFQLDAGLHGQMSDSLLPRAIAGAKDANVTFHTIDVSDPEVLHAKGARRKEGARIGELSEVSASTGGTASSYSDPVKAADRVIADSSLYYLVGYVAEPPKARERPRRIEARTTRAGVRLFVQKTYVPVRPDTALTPSAEAIRAVNDLIPRSELGLRAFAAAFAEPRQKKHSIAVAVEVTVPEGATSQTRFVDDIDMTVVAAAPTSGVRAAQAVTARVALDEPKAHGFDGRYVICARISVDPGRYQLRIGARSALAGRAGSVYLEVDVPNFADQRVSLSDLVFGQTTAHASTPVGRRQTIDDLMPFVPSLTRDFNPYDNAWVFARIYSSQKEADAPVVVEATIRQQGSDAIVWRSQETHLVDFAKRRSSDYRVDLPLSDLLPGDYRLRVEATPSLRDRPSAYRELSFRVGTK